MRTYLANQALESGKPLAREFLGRSPSQMSNYSAGGMHLNPDASQPGKIGMYIQVRHYFLILMMLQ